MASPSPSQAPSKKAHHRRPRPKAAAEHNNTARLATLPEELISNIAARLDCDDLSALRLTCKAVEAKSFHEFATEYFTGKAIMLTSESLKVLVGIANSKRLRTYLHDIYITTAYFSDRTLNCPNGCQCAYQPTFRQSEAYRTSLQDQKKIKETGEDRRMLIKALRKLPEVHNVCLADSFEGFSRSIDVIGLRKVTRRAGTPPSCAPGDSSASSEYSTWLSHVWKVMVQAVAEGHSGISTVKGFGAIIDRPNNGLTLNQNLRFTKKTLAGLTNALANLEKLRLTIRGNSLLKRNGHPDMDASAEVMEQFASILRAPEELELKYDFTPRAGVLHYHFMMKLELSNITRLILDTMAIDVGSLAATIAPMSAIKDLRLIWMDLVDGSWVTILKVLQKLETLQHLHLMWLQEASRKAYFLAQPDMDEAAAVGPDGGWDDVDEGDEDDATEDEENSDDEIPDLEPGVTFDKIDERPQETVGVELADPDNDDEDQEQLDFKSPGHDDCLERGYYVCIKGDQIQKYLPIFIREYNVGESVEEGFGQMNMNTFMNAVTGLMGGPPPPIFGGAGLGGPPGNGAPGPNQGAAGGQGNAVPPGFVSLGGGPGYQMMMGTMPMPGYPPMPAQNAGAGADGGVTSNAPQDAMAGAGPSSQTLGDPEADIPGSNEGAEQGGGLTSGVEQAQSSTAGLDSVIAAHPFNYPIGGGASSLSAESHEGGVLLEGSRDMDDFEEQDDFLEEDEFKAQFEERSDEELD